MCFVRLVAKRFAEEHDMLRLSIGEAVRNAFVYLMFLVPELRYC